MIKFANKRVAGWATRYENMMAVVKQLHKRQARGFCLDSAEQQFLSEAQGLITIYNTFDLKD
jgi:hypothetical protein